MKAVGVILAGGAGSRLGDVRKADLRVGGSTLIDLVSERLTELEQPLLISTGRRPPSSNTVGSSVPDTDLPLAGPLAGLIAAARHLHGNASPETVLITVAVDTPFLPADYVSRLLAALSGGARAAQAGWRESFYPTNAAWRLSDLADLANHGEHNSPRGLLRALGAVVVDWSDTHSLDPFANLNDLNDLVALAKRAPTAAQ